MTTVTRDAIASFFTDCMNRLEAVVDGTDTGYFDSVVTRGHPQLCRPFPGRLACGDFEQLVAFGDLLLRGCRHHWRRTTTSMIRRYLCIPVPPAISKDWPLIERVTSKLGFANDSVEEFMYLQTASVTSELARANGLPPYQWWGHSLQEFFQDNPRFWPHRNREIYLGTSAFTGTDGDDVNGRVGSIGNVLTTLRRSRELLLA